MVTWLNQRVATCHQAGPVFTGVSCVLVFVRFAEGLALCVCEQHLQVCTQVCVSRAPWN